MCINAWDGENMPLSDERRDQILESIKKRKIRKVARKEPDPFARVCLYGYMLKWGPYEFKQKAIRNFDKSVSIHAIGLSKPKLSKQTAQSSETTVEGNTSTNTQGLKPATFTFSLMYAVYLVNQPIHRLVDFWYDKIGQVHPMLFGGGSPVTVLNYNPMKLISIDFSPEIFGGGAWGFVKLDFKFEEVLPVTTTPAVATPESAVDIGA